MAAEIREDEETGTNVIRPTGARGSNTIAYSHKNRKDPSGQSGLSPACVIEQAEQIVIVMTELQKDQLVQASSPDSGPHGATVLGPV